MCLLEHAVFATPGTPWIARDRRTGSGDPCLLLHVLDGRRCRLAQFAHRSTGSRMRACDEQTGAHTGMEVSGPRDPREGERNASKSQPENPKRRRRAHRRARDAPETTPADAARIRAWGRLTPYPTEARRRRAWRVGAPAGRSRRAPARSARHRAATKAVGLSGRSARAVRSERTGRAASRGLGTHLRR